MHVTVYNLKGIRHPEEMPSPVDVPDFFVDPPCFTWVHKSHTSPRETLHHAAVHKTKGPESGHLPLTF